MTKPKLWLTYAWKDNEDAQVDHVYHELIDAGLDVRLDRTQLTVGQRLWPQIDAGITDPEKCGGWAIYATKKSLESEPCLEEIAYAQAPCRREGSRTSVYLYGRLSRCKSISKGCALARHRFVESQSVTCKRLSSR